MEIIWILSRARNSKKFMENWQFFFHHLESNSQEVRQNQPEATPLVIVKTFHQTINTSHYAVHRTNNETRTMSPQHEEMKLGEPPHRAIDKSYYVERRENTEITVSSEHLKDAQAQKDFQSAIQTLKGNCLQGTQQPSDLVQPFQRPNPGEGQVHDLTMDEIYVHVAIHEGRAHHHFAENLDRGKQLKEYPPDEKHCQFTKPEDILDKEHKNVLVVGRPGIGKTSFSTKMLRLWASGEAFNRDALVFNVVFLVKFRRFNDNPELSLRDLLTRAETVECLDDSVWELVQNEPTKVLLIFDGLDEFSRKEDILAQEDYKNNVKEKMPVSVLYKKLAGGQLLRGASILTKQDQKLWHMLHE